MSCFLTGEIVFAKKQDFEFLTNYAKDIARETEDMFHVKFGGNVSNQYLPAVSDRPVLAFEITDSLLENTADALLAPMTVLDAAPWDQRVNGLQKFVNQTLAGPETEKLVLNVCLTPGDLLTDAVQVNCKAPDFPAALEEVFIRSFALPPCGRITVKK